LKVKSVLISQPEPNNCKSPFYDLSEKFNVNLEFRQFIQVEPVSATDFLKNRINILDHNAVIINSRTAIEHFFRICRETRVEVPNDMKFYCISEAFALYLQKFITYRKRKIFFPKTKDRSIHDLLLKHKDENFFFPCSNISNSDIVHFLKTHNIRHTSGILYRTVSNNLSDLNIYDYDVIAFFSPAGIRSLFENFSNFKQNNIRIAGFGENTNKTIIEYGLRLDIEAPTAQAPSMKMALELYLKKNN
jgi:uroporphyrinogen-III synthase